MNKLNTQIAAGVLAAFLAAGTLTGCGKLDGTKTVATIDGETVTLGLASYMTRDQQAQTESYYQMLAQSYGIDASSGLWDGEGDDGKTYGESAKDDVMDNIKMLYVLRAHAADYDVTISDEEQQKIEEAAKTFMEENDASVIEELAVSESDIVTYLELMTYRQKMHDPMVADVDQEVSDEEANQTRITMAKISTAGTETDDDGNTIDLTDEEKAEKKELAEQLLEKVEASDDVAEADISSLASELSEDITVTSPTFTTAGGEDEVLDQSVRDAAVKLDEGEVASDVIEGEDAYYVVRLDKMLDEDATQSKKDSIISDREQEAYNNLLDEWEEAVDMQIDEGVWKKLKVTDSKSFIYKTEDTAAEDAAEDGAEDAVEEDADGEDAAAEDTAGEDTSEENSAGADENGAENDGAAQDTEE